MVIRISVANFRRLSASSDATTTTYPDEQRPQRRLSRGRPDRETYSPSCSEATSSILDAMGITFSTPATKGNGEVHNVLGSHTTNVYNGSVHYHLCRRNHSSQSHMPSTAPNSVRTDPSADTGDDTEGPSVGEGQAVSSLDSSAMVAPIAPPSLPPPVRKAGRITKNAKLILARLKHSLSSRKRT